MKKLTLITSMFLLVNPVEAGLDKFTSLDAIEEWVIERRVDSLTNDVTCRASKSGYGTWFGSRIRLGKKNELLIPEGTSQIKFIDSEIINKVRGALERCRSGLIYVPFEFENSGSKVVLYQPGGLD